MRSWAAVVVITGIASAAWTQTPSPAFSVGVPSAPLVQQQVDDRGVDLKASLKDQQKLLMPPFYVRERDRNFAISKAPLWSEDLTGPVDVSWLKLHNPFSKDAFLSVPAGGQATLPRIYDADQHREESPGTSYKASSYVPLDSWIYPAFDRMAAMGLVPTSSAMVRPWTRLECARLLAEAHDSIDVADDTNKLLFTALDVEFTHEMNTIDGARNIGAQVEGAYGRLTGIAGTPLRDSFHFGQTLSDDYGRPYGQGTNGILGVSGHAEAGPLAFYVRGEYQYASAIDAYSPEAQQAIAASDGLPFGWNLRFGTTSRVRPVEAYVALNLSNWQLSFGQQSLWWGPDRATSLILSNNAEAMPMLRLSRVRPTRLPSLLGLLGPIHFDSFLSREGGVHYVRLGPTFTLYGGPSQPLTPPPVLWGVTVSLKPTANFELGFSHTTIFAGYGRPLTFGTFFHTFSTTGNLQEVDPGKRATQFEFSYNLPGLKKNVVVYTEGFAWDDPLQGKFVGRYAMDPGVYIPRIPKLNRLDLRMEGVYTNLPKLPYQGYFYSNEHYPQGYTNYGQILGSWVGRQGSGGEASSTFWFSARNKATLTYRRMYSDKSFLEGGNLSHISGKVIWLLRPGAEFSAMCQYEQWKFPLLGAGAKSNFTSTFEIRLFPFRPEAVRLSNRHSN